MGNVLRDGKVKTRKEHICHGCLEVIPKGMEVYSQTFTHDDGIDTIYMCSGCIDWCNNRKCIDCLVDENAYEGYIRECKIDNR